MPSFDPSVISQIPDYAPDVTGSMAKGFQLKDLVNTEQLNQLRVNQVKKDQQDDITFRDTLKDFDLSKPDQMPKAAAALAKKGLPEKAMKLMGTAQQYQTGQVEQEEAKLRVAAQQQDQVALALDDVYGKLKKLEAAGATPEMLDLAAAQLAKPAIQRLRNNIPEMGPYLDRFVSEPKNLTFAGIKQAEDQSNKIQGLMKERLAERQTVVKEKAEAETERKDKANEALKHLAAAEGDPKIKAVYGAMADLGISFPSGMRSAKVQRSTIEGLISAHPNDNAQQIAERVRTGGLELTAAKTETTGLARQKASIDRIEKSIVDKGGFLDQAEAAVKEVDLNKVKSLGKLSSWTKEQMSDPALANYHTRITELRAEYAIVLSKGGQVTNEARNEAEKVIPDYLTPAQFSRIRQAIEQGIAASKKAVESSLSESTGKDKGKTYTHPSGAKVTIEEP